MARRAGKALTPVCRSRPGLECDAAFIVNPGAASVCRYLLRPSLATDLLDSLTTAGSKAGPQRLGQIP
jgi:hypothetical protein